MFNFSGGHFSGGYFCGGQFSSVHFNGRVADMLVVEILVSEASLWTSYWKFQWQTYHLLINSGSFPVVDFQW